MKTLLPAPRHVPAWVTPQVIIAVIVGAVVLLVILRLTRIMLHLARAATKAAAPVTAPASAARSSGGRVKLLALAAAAIGGFVLFERAKNTATAVKATPAPSPSPTPRPTITQTVAPHVTAFHFPLTGGQILIALGIAALLAIVLLGPVLRRPS